MKRKLFIILFIIISFLSAGKNGVKEVYNSEMLIFQIDGSLDTVKFPIGEEGKNLNKELLKYLKFYDGKGNLIGDIIEKDEQIYIKFLVKLIHPS